MHRRHFLQTNALTALTASGVLLAARTGRCAAAGRTFTMDLVGGRIGVKTDLLETIALAEKFGFESIGPSTKALERMDQGQLDALLSTLREKGLVWGAADLPVDFRRDEARFAADLRALPQSAAVLSRAGVTRVGTWLRPSHTALTYLANFKQHVHRLREIAKVLGDQGLRFGLEYVGPRTSWTANRHPFIHSMAETKELLAEIGRDNTGFVLDSWHWYTAEETVDDLLTLSATDVVACDLNDAPAGIPVHQQMDLSRELPAATGVIDLKAFLNALVTIGYDGPVRAEPFNKQLNALDNEAAVAATAAAMKKAFALVGEH
jgi:sugar phosphate isomerase/epimerase